MYIPLASDFIDMLKIKSLKLSPSTIYVCVQDYATLLHSIGFHSIQCQVPHKLDIYRETTRSQRYSKEGVADLNFTTYGSLSPNRTDP